MNVDNLLKKRDTIYGVCAIWIIVFHIYRRLTIPSIPIITNILCLGNVGVDIFFFFSGLCLSLSVVKHRYTETGWREYYARRLSRIAVPYVIIGGTYYLWAAIFETAGGTLRKIIAFVADLTSASFWIRGTQTTWFVYGILFFYILFPLIYDFVTNGDDKKNIALLGLMIAFAVCCSYIPVIKNSVIVWARLPIFTIGTIVGAKEKRIGTSSKGITILATIIIILLGWFISSCEISDIFPLPQVYRFILYIPLTISLLIIISRTGSKNDRLFSKVGKLSLEVYLTHITLLHPIRYYGLLDTIGIWLYLFLPIISVLIAEIVGVIEKKIYVGFKL